MAVWRPRKRQVSDISGPGVDVFVGSAGAPGTGKYSVRVRDNGIARVDLDPATDSDSHLLIVSSVEPLVQLAIDEGKKNNLTEVMVLPLH